MYAGVGGGISIPLVSTSVATTWQPRDNHMAIYAEKEKCCTSSGIVKKNATYVMNSPKNLKLVTGAPIDYTRN